MRKIEFTKTVLPAINTEIPEDIMNHVEISPAFPSSVTDQIIAACKKHYNIHLEYIETEAEDNNDLFEIYPADESKNVTEEDKHKVYLAITMCQPFETFEVIK